MKNIVETKPNIQFKERNSNLELLRILAMLLIVAHHYVVNSGITNMYDIQNPTSNMIFLQLWGMWGKAAINIFILISGYFMCKSNLNLNKILKLYLEVKFYKIIIFIMMYFMGYQSLSFMEIFKAVFNVLYGFNLGFTGSFFAFYVFIPFYNLLINKMSKKEHISLIFMLIFMFTIVGTFINASVFHHMGWYMTLYFVAAYIRMYPNKLTESCSLNFWVLGAVTLLSYMSIIAFDIIHIDRAYYFVSDSHKLFALIIGLSAFLAFKNLNIQNNKAINIISMTTFGVFMIHANSDAMRTFLWNDLLKVPSMYNVPIMEIFMHALISMIGVFVVCSLIDVIRIYVLEKPLFKFLTKKFPVLNKSLKCE